MLEYLKQEANMTLTENGAATYASTYSDCLDLFASIGSMRSADEAEIIARFLRAYVESPDMAMKLLFFARDVRGGLGERRVFRVLLKWLAHNYPESVKKNLSFVAEYGRYDDLLALLGSPCEKAMLELIRAQFDSDWDNMFLGLEVSLLAKWLPSVNASNPTTVANAKKIARAFGLTDAQYRKALSALRAHIHILENDLRRKDYSFDYEKQPSTAMFKYRMAFCRWDYERYSEFLNKVKSGTAKLHADTLAPYQLVDPYIDIYSTLFDGQYSYMRPIAEDEKAVLNATWAALPSFGSNDNALAVVDTSGSMYYSRRPFPASIALSLGLYFAQHNTGAFKNCFIEFSAKPRFIELKGETFADKLRYASSFSQMGNTDLQAVFDLVLDAAVKNHVPQEQLPSKLVIISDMEFDACVNNASATNFENARAKYAAQGYTLPQIVFWNVESRKAQQPVTKNQQGVALVSGVSPRLFSMIAGELSSPYDFMMDVLGSDRYLKIAA